MASINIPNTSRAASLSMRRRAALVQRARRSALARAASVGSAGGTCTSGRLAVRLPMTRFSCSRASRRAHLAGAAAVGRRDVHRRFHVTQPPQTLDTCVALAELGEQLFLKLAQIRLARRRTLRF